MRKLIVLVGLMLFLVGCSKNLTSDDIDELDKGMSSDKVTELIGKPKQEIKVKSEIRAKIEPTIENLKTVSDLEGSDGIFENQLSDAEYVLELTKDLENVTAHVYDYTNQDDKKSEKIIYYLDDEIIFID